MAPVYAPIPVDEVWEATCRQLAGMRLKELHVRLKRNDWFGGEPLWSEELIASLRAVHTTGEFQVVVNWDVSQLPAEKFQLTHAGG